jgi:hypothetical protein
MAKRVGKRLKTEGRTADDGRLYDSAHDTAVTMSSVVQHLEACADRIVLLALDLEGLRGSGKRVRVRVDVLAEDLELWAALTLQRMAKWDPEDWLKDDVRLRFQIHHGQLVGQVSPADGTPCFDMLAEVVEPLDRRRVEWLRLFDSGLFKDLAAELRGLASAVRETARVCLGIMAGGKHQAQRLLELARREAEAIARLSHRTGRDVLGNGGSTWVDKWDGKEQLHGPVLIELDLKECSLAVGGRKMRHFRLTVFDLFSRISLEPSTELTAQDVGNRFRVANPRVLVAQVKDMFRENRIRDPSPIIDIRKEPRGRRKLIFEWKAMSLRSRTYPKPALRRFLACFP